MFNFWQVQSEKLLFPEIEWSRPEQKLYAGKLLIIGGGAGQVRSLAQAYETALRVGAGEVRILAPDSLRKLLNIEKLTDVTFVSSNISGGFSRESFSDFLAAEKWADSILFIGETGKNSETSALFERFIIQSEKPIFITRDSVDILMGSFSQILPKENITILASFAQLQKIFISIFYPKVLTFSMKLPQLVDNLHKFTFTYPSQIITFHEENIIIAQGGRIFSCPQNSQISNGKISPIHIWNGEIPTKIAVWQMWNPAKIAEAAITGVVS